MLKTDANGDTLVRYIDAPGETTDARTTANDTLIPVNANASLRGGGGNDLYELHDRIQQDIQLVDTEGDNSLFLNDGLEFESIHFSCSGVKFDLMEAGSVSVLGDMETFTFVLGGNVRTGEKGTTTFSFDELASQLGLDTLPESGIESVGAWQVSLTGLSEIG